MHSYPLSMVEGCSEKSANYEESSHQNLTILVLDFQPPELRNEFLLFVSHSVCGILLQLPKQTKTSSNHSFFFFFFFKLLFFNILFKALAAQGCFCVALYFQQHLFSLLQIPLDLGSGQQGQEAGNQS